MLSAQELKGPRLGVAANFSQGWRPDILDASAKIPVLDFRDTVHWAVAEKPGKRFDFRGWRTSFPGVLRGRGVELGLFLNANHPNYDQGNTAHTKEAVAAFGAYAARVVSQFSNIRSVEMGNEFNGEDFVSGPARTYDMDARARYYVALLKAVHDAAKQVDPTIRITGGGVHSIPVNYLSKVFSHGGGQYMDALAIHTYTTPAEHLVRQIAVLRSLPEARELPIEVTEFGTLNREKAAGFFLRNYCQMALSGVDRAVWYPMHPRGDGLIPTIEDDGRITSVGRAYGFAQTEFAGLKVRPFAPDPFTFGCQFGDGKLVVWGEPRDVTIAEGVSAFSQEGLPLADGGLQLGRNDPIVLIKNGAFAMGVDVQFEEQATVADSFYQLEYPGYSTVSESHWSSHFEFAGQVFDFQTMPGQERQGVPWVPYLGHSDHADLRLAADYLVPIAAGSIVQRFAASHDMSVEIDAFWNVGANSEDGIIVSVLKNGVELFQKEVTKELRISERRVDLNRDDILMFRVSANQNPWGDYTEYRVNLRKNAPQNMPSLTSN